MCATDEREMLLRVTAIQRELQKVEELAQTLARLQARRKDSDCGKAARYLLKFYAVCERILILIEGKVEGRLVRHVDWRSRLLLEAEISLPGVRSPILTASHCKLLQKLLAFRNLQRNIYGYVPAPYVIEKLSALVIAQQPQLAAEIQQFLAFLKQHAHAGKKRLAKKTRSISYLKESS